MKEKKKKDEPPGESWEDIKRRLINNSHTFKPDGDQPRQNRNSNPSAVAAPSRRT